jgi:NADH-quinone oxidoreductase subunit N
LIGVVASVAAAFFYLRVIVLMYMQEPQGSMDEDRSLMPRVAIAIPAILTLVLGIFPGLIVGILERASILRW